MEQTSQTPPVAPSATIPTTPPPAPAGISTTPTPPASTVVNTSAPKGHKKLIWVIIIVFVLICLGVGGYYFYSQNMSGQSEVITSQNSSQNQELQQLENEVNSTPIDDVDAQFIEVDKEIQSL